MSVHTLPNIELAAKKICHLEKFENLSKTHPILKDPRIRKAIYALLDDTPKTGDDILLILASVPGKIAYILKILEDPNIVEWLGIRGAWIAKAEVFSSSSLFDNEIIDREVPALFLYRMRNQKIRAKAYSLWNGFKEYMKIVVKEPHSPYAVNIAYTALSLHKLGISPDQLPEGGMLIVNGKRYQIEHNYSFLSMAKDFHDIVWDGIKKHRIRKDTDIGKILDEINHMWNDGQNGVTRRNDNIVYANFRE